MGRLRYRGKILLRILCSLLLGICVVMLVLGCTFLRDRLHGAQFLLYWSWCFLISVAAVIVALVDMALIRRASRREQHELFQEQFGPPSRQSAPSPKSSAR